MATHVFLINNLFPLLHSILFSGLATVKSISMELNYTFFAPSKTSMKFSITLDKTGVYID